MKLSHVSHILAGMVEGPNPWRRAAEDWAHIQIVRRDLGAKTNRGETRWFNGRPVAVVLHECLNQRERRSTLAHELEHLDRGQPCGTLRAVIEAQVCAATARYLLPDIDELGRVLAVYDLRQAAVELWVSHQVLVDRLNHLSDAESLHVHSFREGIA